MERLRMFCFLGCVCGLWKMGQFKLWLKSYTNANNKKYNNMKHAEKS